MEQPGPFRKRSRGGRWKIRGKESEKDFKKKERGKERLEQLNLLQVNNEVENKENVHSVSSLVSSSSIANHNTLV
jgi:hypothetical protein